MKHSKLLPYEAPCTLVTRILTEGSVCGSATVTNKDVQKAGITEQEVNTDFGVNGTFNADKWDSQPDSPTL